MRAKPYQGMFGGVSAWAFNVAGLMALSRRWIRLGEVAAVEEKVIHLKLADNVKVRVVKSAVAGLESDPAALIEGAPK